MMIDIRFMGCDEIIAAMPCFCALLRDSIEDNASMGFMAEDSHEELEYFWKQAAQGVKDGLVLLVVAEQDGVVVGTVHARFAQKANQQLRGDVMKLIVHRNARGKRISRLLMEALEAECLRLGRWLLVLDTATGSVAEAIYPRFGWSRVGVVPDYALYPVGGYCDTTIFYKRLTA